jgi:NAD(P)-dependent dehydrogenase (short-subunit alcohol dehydrogenase family)
MTDLRGQKAVVTGGSRGLGQAFAQALAAIGADVVTIARSHADFSLDVNDAARVEAVFREIGPVDLLINNAGIFGPIGPFAESDVDLWWQVSEVSVRGAMLCTRAVLPGMIARRRGRIVNLVTGMFSAPYISAYLAAKTALVRVTECLAAENQAHGVAFFALAPGSVRTDMATRSLTSPEGREWIPWFQRIYDEGLDLPAEEPAALLVALASGKYDALTGLYLTPFDDLDAMRAELEEIGRNRWHTLQLRPRKVSELAARIGAIRAAALPKVR